MGGRLDPRSLIGLEAGFGAVGASVASSKRRVNRGHGVPREAFGVTRRPAQSSAPGKVILFGEHAVVYGEPAIAVPVNEVEAKASIVPAEPGRGLIVIASDLGTSLDLSEAPHDAPLARAARVTLGFLGVPPPDATLTVQSTIPIASGLGSGAAVSTALVRALALFVGRPLEPSEVSDLVYDVERIHHGTPSGIDNTVIAYEQPVYFVRDARSGPVPLSVGTPFRLLIADTGLPSPTRQLVSQVRERREHDRERYDAILERIGGITRRARCAIETGEVRDLGPLMTENHQLLVDLGVSSPALNALVDAARQAGAMGAKLSGAGQGGNTVALIPPAAEGRVGRALNEAGAARVIRTDVGQRHARR